MYIKTLLALLALGMHLTSASPDELNRGHKGHTTDHSSIHRHFKNTERMANPATQPRNKGHSRPGHGHYVTARAVPPYSTYWTTLTQQCPLLGSTTRDCRTGVEPELPGWCQRLHHLECNRQKRYPGLVGWAHPGTPLNPGGSALPDLGESSPRCIYYFLPDAGREVRVVGECAQRWGPWGSWAVIRGWGSDTCVELEELTYHCGLWN